MNTKPGGEQAYQELVAKNQDVYGAGIVKYAERWAALMEGAKEVSGELTPDIMNRCSHDADIDGITGFMFGAAVSVLAEHWVHGETVRQWHNAEHGYSGDGVVNPAVFTA